MRSTIDNLSHDRSTDKSGYYATENVRNGKYYVGNLSNIKKTMSSDKVP